MGAGFIEQKPHFKLGAIMNLKRHSRFAIFDLHLRPRSSRREEALTVSRLNQAASIAAQPVQPIPEPGPIQRFNDSTIQRPQSAFTLVELLVVIAIIGILAAMILQVLSQATIHARKVQAKLNVSQIANAIEEYDSLYSHMPVSSLIEQSGFTNVTYGGTYTSAAGAGAQFPAPSDSGWGASALGYTTPVGLYVTSNADVMAILLDQTNYPNTTASTVNVGHGKNPMQKALLSVKFAGDAASPGVGTDLNYRDPWGNPYLISMDLNGDNKCEDPFYAPVTMSSSTGVVGGPGVNGLSYQASDGNYLFHGNVMVWSMGPNGPYYHSQSSFTYSPSSPAPSGAWAMDPSNKNHILSWAL
jgi:prepilin-type N-terminal cleavage/methylation domain-containing protein